MQLSPNRLKKAQKCFSKQQGRYIINLAGNLQRTLQGQHQKDELLERGKFVSRGISIPQDFLIDSEHSC
jgi:hypothetical protein